MASATRGCWFEPRGPIGSTADESLTTNLFPGKHHLPESRIQRREVKAPCIHAGFGDADGVRGHERWANNLSQSSANDLRQLAVVTSRSPSCRSVVSSAVSAGSKKPFLRWTRPMSVLGHGLCKWSWCGLAARRKRQPGAPRSSPFDNVTSSTIQGSERFRTSNRKVTSLGSCLRPAPGRKLAAPLDLPR